MWGGGGKNKVGDSRPFEVLQKLSKYLKSLPLVFSGKVWRIVWIYECWNWEFWIWPSFSPRIWFRTFVPYLHWNVSQTLSLFSPCRHGLTMLHYCTNSSGAEKHEKSCIRKGTLDPMVCLPLAFEYVKKIKLMAVTHIGTRQPRTTLYKFRSRLDPE